MTTWLQRLAALPAAYRTNVREALKLAAVFPEDPGLWTIRYYALRIALLTLRRRTVQQHTENERNERMAREIAQAKTIAQEIDRGGTAGMVIAPNSASLDMWRHDLFGRVASPLRMYLRTERRAEFANGSTVRFRLDRDPNVARGPRLDWVWFVSPDAIPGRRMDEWTATLRPSMDYSRGRLYIGFDRPLEPHRRP